MVRTKRKTPIEKEGILHYHCTKCNKFKVKSCFEKRYDYDNIRSHCKTCRNYDSAYYHRTVVLRMSEEQTYFELQVKADPELSIKKQILRRAKLNAKKKGLDYSLTVLDIILPKVCPILKQEFIPKHNKYTWSIDRLNNSIGYVKENIRIISRLANTMKNNATNDELILFANNIKTYIKI